MLDTKDVRVACAVALFAGMSVTTAFAQTPDKRTLFTFSGPVTMPGVTLPAGQYLFRLADPSTSAKVVHVLSADGTKPYGMFFSYPAERFEASSKPEVRFMETATGMPAAIKTWWYPGERTGFEFIYPKDQARKLAQGASLPVLTTQTQTTTTEQTNTPDLARVSSTGPDTNVSADTKAAATTPTGTTQEGTIAASSIAIQNPSNARTGQTDVDKSSVTTTAATTGTVARASRARLPKTASSVPIFGVIGVVAILGAASLHVWRIRTARDRMRM
jgi:cobalamin biosynthesis Mg chelatase CobN